MIFHYERIVSMRIIADTSALIPPAEGAEQGMTVIPICVSIGDKTYQDYTEISCEEFLAQVRAGGVPTSSQPAVGDVLDVMESGDEEMLFLTVGDGLSGAYQTVMGARNLAENPERIQVINSKTLGGPLRYLAKKAVALKDQGLSMAQIVEALEPCVESSMSFVIPEDFEFLKRSGRLTAITAKIGGILKLLPVLTQSKDRTRISPVGIKRSWPSAVEMILQRLAEHEVGAEHLISVCYADTPEKGERILQQVQARFPETEIELLQLSPALMTHGGPGCIVIQAIRK